MGGVPLSRKRDFPLLDKIVEDLREVCRDLHLH